MTEIVPAGEGDALRRLIELSDEYVSWITEEVRKRYPMLDVDEFNAERRYDDVRKKFPGEHLPPDGQVLVAIDGTAACGCVAVARLSETVCEMQTLYVRPRCRGSGVGRMLAEASIEEARRLGYSRMRLDTLAFLEGAVRLYRSIGFREIRPYHKVATALKGQILFFELDLKEAPSRTRSGGVSRPGRIS